MSAQTNFVFLHGGNHGSWCWERLINALQTQGCGQTLALDIPGCGLKRGSVPEDISLDDVADELIADVRGAGIESAVLVGHSMAGVVMPYLAGRAPELFTSRIYISACVPRQGESVMQTMGAGLRGIDPTVVGYPVDPNSTDPLELMRAMFGPGLSEEDIAWVLGEAAMDQWPMSLPMAPLEVDSAKLHSPAAYIVTERDPILPPHWQGCFAERAGARVVMSIDDAHEVFLSKPVELARLVHQAVAALDA